MIIDFGNWTLVWCALAMLLGGVIKGTLGIGTPLLTVPMMAMVLPAHMAVTMMIIPVIVANLWQVREASNATAIVRRYWPAFIALFLGTWVGVKILSGIDERPLLMFVGIAVICFTLLQGSRRKILIPESLVKVTGFLFGLCSGIIGGLSSMFGPMLVLYLVSLGGLKKNEFVGIISFLYVAAVLSWGVILLSFNMLSKSLILSSTLALLPLTIGLGLGRSLRNRVEERLFHRLVWIILLASGSSMLWRASNLGSTVS
ncbi:MAG: sulfite exporter TauE/SafE family protein [bacterium]